jgi:GTP-binding protein
VRYLTNGLRADFEIPGVPIRIHFKAGENPFEGRKKKR